MGGLFRRMKLTGAAFIVGALALSGIPPLSGFFSKDMILEAAAERGAPFVTVALVLAAGLTAFYMGRVVLVAFFGKPAPGAEHAREPGASMLVPVLLLALPTATLGMDAGRISRLLGHEHAFHLGTTGSVALAFAGAGWLLAILVFGARLVPDTAVAAFAAPARLARSAAVDRLWLLGYRRAVLGVSDVSGWFDRYVIDATMNVVGWATIRSGQALRVVQTGNVMDYAYVLMLAVAVLVVVGAVR
jgi:NADH-quinone oxidoreductase subunit L